MAETTFDGHLGRPVVIDLCYPCQSFADVVERPNRIVWDLDPGPEIAWKQVITAAEQLRDVLQPSASPPG